MQQLYEQWDKGLLPSKDFKTCLRTLHGSPLPQDCESLISKNSCVNNATYGALLQSLRRADVPSEKKLDREPSPSFRRGHDRVINKGNINTWSQTLTSPRKIHEKKHFQHPSKISELLTSSTFESPNTYQPKRKQHPQYSATPLYHQAIDQDCVNRQQYGYMQEKFATGSSSCSTASCTIDSVTTLSNSVKGTSPPQNSIKINEGYLRHIPETDGYNIIAQQYNVGNRDTENPTGDHPSNNNVPITSRGDNGNQTNRLPIPTRGEQAVQGDRTRFSWDTPPTSPNEIDHTTSEKDEDSENRTLQRCKKPNESRHPLQGSKQVLSHHQLYDNNFDNRVSHNYGGEQSQLIRPPQDAQQSLPPSGGRESRNIRSQRQNGPIIDNHHQVSLRPDPLTIETKHSGGIISPRSPPREITSKVGNGTHVLSPRFMPREITSKISNTIKIQSPRGTVRDLTSKIGTSKKTLSPRASAQELTSKIGEHIRFRSPPSKKSKELPINIGRDNIVLSRSKSHDVTCKVVDTFRIRSPRYRDYQNPGEIEDFPKFRDVITKVGGSNDRSSPKLIPKGVSTKVGSEEKTPLLSPRQIQKVTSKIGENEIMDTGRTLSSLLSPRTVTRKIGNEDGDDNLEGFGNRAKSHRYLHQRATSPKKEAQIKIGNDDKMMPAWDPTVLNNNLPAPGIVPELEYKDPHAVVQKNIPPASAGILPGLGDKMNPYNLPESYISPPTHPIKNIPSNLSYQHDPSQKQPRTVRKHHNTEISNLYAPNVIIDPYKVSEYENKRQTHPSKHNEPISNRNQSNGLSLQNSYKSIPQDEIRNTQRPEKSTRRQLDSSQSNTRLYSNLTISTSHPPDPSHLQNLNRQNDQHEQSKPIIPYAQDIQSLNRQNNQQSKPTIPYAQDISQQLQNNTGPNYDPYSQSISIPLQNNYLEESNSQSRPNCPVPSDASHMINQESGSEQIQRPPRTSPPDPSDIINRVIRDHYHETQAVLPSYDSCQIQTVDDIQPREQVLYYRGEDSDSQLRSLQQLNAEREKRNRELYPHQLPHPTSEPQPTSDYGMIDAYRCASTTVHRNPDGPEESRHIHDHGTEPKLQPPSTIRIHNPGPEETLQVPSVPNGLSAEYVIPNSDSTSYISESVPPLYSHASHSNSGHLSPRSSQAPHSVKNEEQAIRSRSAAVAETIQEEQTAGLITTRPGIRSTMMWSPPSLSPERKGEGKIQKTRTLRKPGQKPITNVEDGMIPKK